MPADRSGDSRLAEDALTERERHVLQALIDAHIATAEPVGSKALAQRSDMGVSPATVRNVLAALHDKGLIEQPHTSAGRVPTDRGLRYYVDCLVRLQTPALEVQGQITARIGDAGPADAALREASRVLMRLSRHTTLVFVPTPEEAPLKHVELVRLRDDAVLLILVTAEGKVQNRLLEWAGPAGEAAPPSAVLERAGRRITDLVSGRTLAAARAVLAATIAAAQGELQDLERKVLTLSASGLSASGLSRTEAEATVHVEGTAHLLETTRDLDRTRELLSLLDEDERVRSLLEEVARAPGVRIFIGEENPSSALAERGVVTAGIGPGGSMGVLGVIGPRHLDYGRIVPLVDLTAQVVGRALQR